MLFPKQAAKHQDCIKWLLANHKSQGKYNFEPHILALLARNHGLSCLKWCRENCELPDPLWNQHLFMEAAAMADLPMLEWLRGLDLPVPWTAAVCRAAAAHGSISALAWLRNQEPPCPWDIGVTAAAAAAANGIGTLEWLRAQHPPCPWDVTVAVAAASQSAMSNAMDILEWLHEHGCPFGEDVSWTASYNRNLPMLQWLHLHGCPLHPECPSNATDSSGLPMLVWLHQQGCALTSDLYIGPALNGESDMLRCLHSWQVPAPGRDICRWKHGPSLPHLMFLADIGAELPEREEKLVMQARKAYCTFHGLARWCRQAISDPSRGAHRAYASMAKDRSGEVLLWQLSRLPNELLNKIAIAAELQHDILSPGILA